jgi:HlyD family secretion protein
MTIGVAFLAIILIFFIVKSCGSDIEYEYTYEEASVGTVEKTISATGVLEVDGKQPIPAKINGLVSSVKVVPEQKIQRNQVVAIIDSSDIDQRLLMLNTKLESSRLNVAAQQRRYEGKKNMFKENLVSEKDLEQTELEYKTALNNHKLLQIEYSETLSQKRDSVVRSPIDGIVVESVVGPLSSVSRNGPMFYIAPSLAKMQLMLNIDESDIGSIKKNQKVVFTVSAFPDKKFNGEITYVSINPDKRGGLVTYQSNVLCDNSDLLLKPGMTPRLQLLLQGRKRSSGCRTRHL